MARPKPRPAPFGDDLDDPQRQSLTDLEGLTRRAVKTLGDWYKIGECLCDLRPKWYDRNAPRVDDIVEHLRAQGIPVSSRALHKAAQLAREYTIDDLPGLEPLGMEGVGVLLGIPEGKRQGFLKRVRERRRKWTSRELRELAMAHVGGPRRAARRPPKAPRGQGPAARLREFNRLTTGWLTFDEKFWAGERGLAARLAKLKGRLKGRLLKELEKAVQGLGRLAQAANRLRKELEKRLRSRRPGGKGGGK